MYTKKDQNLLAEAYGKINEMNLGPAGMGEQPAGMPVMVRLDMPGTETDHSEQEEEHDPSEIEMASSELHKLTEYASKLKEMVADMPSLEGWVAAKITKASDYISSVYHWLEYNQHETGDGCGCEHGEGMYNQGAETHCSYAAKGCTCGGCSECA